MGLTRRLQKEVVAQGTVVTDLRMEGQPMPRRGGLQGGAVSCGFHSVPDWGVDIFLHLVGAKADPVPHPGYPIEGVFQQRMPLWL